MVDATTYLRGQLSSWIADGEAFASAPTNIYVALHSAEPGSDASQNELTAGGYSRYESTVPGDWTETTDGEFQNAVDFIFDEATEDWGEVTHFSLWDGPDPTDNALAEDSMVTSVNVTTGDAPVFRDGNMSGTFE